MNTDVTTLLDAVKWNDAGLVPAIAQDAESGKVLMLAWMNAEALSLSLNEGKAVYWSRSRSRLWRKGESSGNEQSIRELRLDCDGDTVLMLVDQRGGIACHTGRESCFYRKSESSGWQVVEPVLRDPHSIYSSDKS